MPKITNNHFSEVRVIGGSYKNSKIQFNAIEGLRPTSNRLREVLFNWLQFELSDKTILDLFAGSGALGFETSSRGAKKVILLEKNKTAYECLKQNQTKHHFNNLDIIWTDAFDYLKKPLNFDIIFCDPPFHKDYISKLIETLKEIQNCLIYFESEYKISDKNLPLNWQIKKEKKVSSVYACLVQT